MARIDSKWVKSEYKEIILYLFLGIFATIVIPLFVGFVLLGFEESFVTGQPLLFGAYLTNYIVYLAFIIASLFLIIYPLARLISIKRNEHPATQQPVSWFRIFTCSFIYSPEENGFLYWLSEKLGMKGKKNFMRWSLNPLRVLIIAILLFGAYGLVQVANPQLTISGVPQLQLQQVTIASEVIFSAEPASWGENGLLLFVFSLLMGINAYVCAKFRLGILAFFIIGFLVVCPLMGLNWMGYHRIVYGNSDAGMFATFVYGWAGSTLTLLTGIFLLWWIWHIMNNSFLKLSEIITAKEDIFLITGIILGLLLVIWISVEFWASRRRKRKQVAEVSIPGN